MSSKRKSAAPSNKALDALLRAARSHVKPSMQERALGLQAKNSGQAWDYFRNALARTGYDTPGLMGGTEYPLVRLTFNYWELVSLYEGSWVPRRIVDVPAQDMVRAWPTLTSDISPKELTRIDRALRRTNAKNNLLIAMQWARLFGGAGALIVIKGQEHDLDQSLDLDTVPVGGFKGLIPFDRWSGIRPSADWCTDLDRPLDFNLPESYEVQASGGQSFKVHASRILRFTGPTVPTPEREAYSMWGVSVIEPVMQELEKLDNVSWNIVNLTFRANILGMKFPDLAATLSGLGAPTAANQKFQERMAAVNHLISNQSLVPLPADGGIESTQYSFSGLGEVYQQVCLNVSGAAQIPVARLWGRTITGLGQTGDGDEKIYIERIATDQDTYLRPQLEKLYPVLCASELGEVPDDLDLNFPSLAVPDDKEKSELAKTVVDTVTVAMNGGLITPRTAAKELKQSSDKTGIFTNITDEDIAKLSDEVQSEGELGEGLFGKEGGGLNPASSPAKALKEENREADQGGPNDDGPENPQPSGAVPFQGHGGAPRGAEDEGMAGLRRLVGQAKDAAYEIRPGDRLKVHGKMLVVDHVVVGGTKDLFGNPTVQVHFTTGEIVPYRVDSAEAKDADGPAAGTINVHGLTCVIETPKGYQRHGRDGDGRPWRVTMGADYGYIDGCPGADGDSLDCYVDNDPGSNWVYVVDQRHLPPRRGFDESKVMLGFSSQGDALRTYRANHHRTADVYMDFTPMRVEDFKEWLATRDPKRPCGTEVVK